MAESQATANKSSSRGIALRDRAIRMGNIVGINGYRLNRPTLRDHFVAIGYQTHETPHFLLCTHRDKPTVLIHWFAPEDVNVNVGYFCIEELRAFGLPAGPQEFSDMHGAIVLSLNPHDVQKAVHLYGINSLRRYHYLLDNEKANGLSHSTLEIFAHLYRRVCELLVGNSFLDAGCSFGFLPLLVAERMPSLQQILGIDLQTEPFPVATTIAQERHLANVRFIQADLLSDNIKALGHFDTVVALHVIEHFTEPEMYQVLPHLLEVTSRRLILAVPFEKSPDIVHGHQQTFSPPKLEAVGKWCIERLEGKAQMHYEDCVGGLLLIEKGPLER